MNVNMLIDIDMKYKCLLIQQQSKMIAKSIEGFSALRQCVLHNAREILVQIVLLRLMQDEVMKPLVTSN